MKKFFFLTILTVLFTTACKSSKNMQTPEASTTQQYSFNNETKWVLTLFDGKAPAEAGFKQRLPYMVIDKKAGSIGGNSGCNSFNGPVEIEGSKIKIGMLAATKAYCIGVPEHDFFNNLNEADSFILKGDSLKLLKDSKILMVFKAEKK